MVSPLNGFVLYDDRLVTIELFSGKVVLRNPQDVAYHANLFDYFLSSALTGSAATSFLEAVADEFICRPTWVVTFEGSVRRRLREVETVSVIESEAAQEQQLWRVRYTWAVVECLPHPEFTYDRKFSETWAVDSAVSMIDRNDDRTAVYIVCAYIQRPGSDDWRQVDYAR